MKTVLILWHSMTGGSQALAQAAAKGVKLSLEVSSNIVAAASATPEDLIAADGYIFVFPENLAAISGVMKACFDNCYYPCSGENRRAALCDHRLRRFRRKQCRPAGRTHCHGMAIEKNCREPDHLHPRPNDPRNSGAQKYFRS